MKIVTAGQMKAIDRRAIDELKIPSLTLMENAGNGVVETIVNAFPGEDRQNVLIICGKGNNGGDGLVVARRLKEMGVRVTVIMLCEIDEVKGDARTNLDRALASKVVISEVTSRADLIKNSAYFQDCQVIVDAMLGTGAVGKPSAMVAEAIKKINESGKPIIAVDIPSGLDADTGSVPDVCVSAKITTTMGLPKRGQVLYPGNEYVRKLKVIDIGIPQELLEDTDIQENLIDRDMVGSLLPRRPPIGHKGTFGHLFVLAGSVGKTGAAALASMAAMRSGVGLVTNGIPKSLNDIMEIKLTEPMTLPLAETKTQSLSMDAVDDIARHLKNTSAMALGPGLSEHPETAKLVHHLLTTLELPMVLDADALNALADKIDLLGKCEGPLVLTPHPGEFSRLVDMTRDEVLENRIDVAREFAVMHHVILVLKGAQSIVANYDGQVYINPTGNDGMATGGTGDVLAGMIGALLAQGIDPLACAIIAVYVHGLSGDLARNKMGKMPMIASDLLDYLPQAWLDIRE